MNTDNKIELNFLQFLFIQKKGGNMKLTRRKFFKIGISGVILPVTKILGCDKFDEVEIFTVIGSLKASREGSVLSLFSPEEIKIRTDFKDLEGIPFITEIQGYKSEDLEFLVNHKLITASVDQVTVFPGDLISWGEFWEEIPENQVIESENGIGKTTFALRRRRRVC